MAAVFINRLRRRMKLESDPTTIYGLTGGKAPLNRELTRADLQSTSPYNTYDVAGLPPGPICNPGRASIVAATNPARDRSLYFVADGQGGHAFALTLPEHNRNVERWRADPARAPGSSAVADTGATGAGRRACCACGAGTRPAVSHAGDRLPGARRAGGRGPRRRLVPARQSVVDRAAAAVDPRRRWAASASAAC